MQCNLHLFAVNLLIVCYVFQNDADNEITPARQEDGSAASDSESDSAEMGPGGLVGLIAGLSGVS